MNMIIRNAKVINEGTIVETDLKILNGRIEKIGQNISSDSFTKEIDASGKYLMPGIIDDQVHFREPGLTAKADIASESKAALAGGVTSFMEMPNTVPNALTQALLQDKYDIAEKTAWTNYSFFMGGSNDNYDQAMRTDLSQICGLKLFMGSSTGNMLVDNPVTLEKIFSDFPGLIATHCEDETTVKNRMTMFKEKYENSSEIPYDIHAQIRNVDACYISSSMAIDLAKKHNTRLHILHISTAKELDLFSNLMVLDKKRITSEVCVHHLYFDAQDYKRLGNQIKCNPAIKSDQKDALFKAMLDNRLDIIATDHAPHLWSEKQQDYWSAPSGLPLVQHSLNLMLDFYHKGMISLERIIEKMCHAPAQCFKIENRGFIREGFMADLVLFDLEKMHTIEKDNILYKCGWSPLEGTDFKGQIEKVWVSGELQFDNGNFYQKNGGKRLTFNPLR